MARKYESIPADTFSRLALGAGVILTDFSLSNPGTLNRANILCATDGGVNVTVTPEFADMADGLDNCPANTKELKRIKSFTVTMSGTGKTLDEAMTKRLLPSASASTTSGLTTVTLSGNIASAEFADLYLVCDYGATDGGFAVAHIKNALNTGGFTMQTTDGDKASFAFTFSGHYSLDNISAVPFEFGIYPGTSAGTSAGT